jgi:uncharacterized protein (TIGR02266 family)
MRRTQLRFRIAGEPAVLAGTTQDVGTGGAFVVTATPPAVGATVTLLLDAPDGRSFEISAEVRWTVPADGNGRDAGMGVQFVALDADQHSALTAWLASLPIDTDYDPPP